MSFIDGLKGAISFLTIIPISTTSKPMEATAKHMYLFPAVGAGLGSLAALASLALDYHLPINIIAWLAFAMILILNGAHHTDGLLDFGDGVMCKGPVEKKIAAMKDQNLGAGGFLAGFLVILITGIGFQNLGMPILAEALIVSETNAKFSMVLLAKISRSAYEGSSTPFTAAMHDRFSGLRLGLAAAITLVVSFPLLGSYGFLAIILSGLTAVVLGKIAFLNFHGVNGDVFGATNEIARLLSVIALLAMKS